MDEVRRRLAQGLVRGTVAAMAMTGVRQVTTGLGLVEQTPPAAIIKQREVPPASAVEEGQGALVNRRPAQERKRLC